MSEPKHTVNLRVRSEPSAGGFVIESPDVGKGYYSGVGHATQRDPHPRDGGGISAETAKANATLWAAAPGLLAAAKDLLVLVEAYSNGRSVTAELLLVVERHARSEIAQAEGRS